MTVYEIRAELEDGFQIRDGTTTPLPWRGARIAYRPLGSRGRWTRFLLEYDEQPSIADLQRVCAAHESTQRVREHRRGRIPR